MQRETIVVKIGGSTLGNHDTTLEDLVELQKKGKHLVIVHGGGKVTSEWLARLGIPTSFANGLRVTDEEILKVVAAALGGLVNKELVVAIQALGGKVIGLSGCDGNLLWASIKSLEMGYVGEIAAALAAGRLTFLTDVDGIRNGAGQTVATLNLAEARDMLASGIASKGMIPKMEASLRALTTTKVVRIIDGRVAQALRDELAGQAGQTKLGGTTIGTE